jgi:hypothetical protein
MSATTTTTVQEQLVAMRELGDPEDVMVFTATLGGTPYRVVDLPLIAKLVRGLDPGLPVLAFFPADTPVNEAGIPYLMTPAIAGYNSDDDAAGITPFEAVSNPQPGQAGVTVTKGAASLGRLEDLTDITLVGFGQPDVRPAAAAA